MLEYDGHESIRRPELSSDIQRIIGQRLSQHYSIEQSLPARLADLLKELEQRSNELETVAPRSLCERGDGRMITRKERRCDYD
jgi:hypothetical protein